MAECGQADPPPGGGALQTPRPRDGRRATTGDGVVPPAPRGGAPRRGRVLRSALPLVAVLALMAGLRLYHVGVPFIDTSDWRQTDTAAIAYFYYHLGVALLHPQLWHDGPGPDYTQLELQIAPTVAALLAHVFGYSDLLLRLVAIALDTASAIPLWALARRRLGPRAALWCALVYAVLPLGIYFGRVFQPEPAMLLTGNAALWAADRFGRRPNLRRYLAAVALLALAVLAKLPDALLILPALVLALGPGHPRLWRGARRKGALGGGLPRLAALAGMALLPVVAGAAYTLAEGRGAANGTRYVTFIIRSLPEGYIAGQTHLWRFIWHNALGMAITPAGAVAAAVGLAVLAPRWLRGRHAWLAAWGLALAVYALVVLRAIRLQYYLMPLLPWVAVLCAVGLRAVAQAGQTRGTGSGAPAAQAAPTLAAPTPPGASAAHPTRPAGTAGTAAWRRWFGPAAAGLLTVSILSGGLFQIAAYWPPYWPWYRLGMALRRDLPASATVLVGGTFNPTLLYYARRHGWRTNPVTVQAVEESPADYLVPAVDPGACMDAFLATHYRWLLVEGTRVYDLKEPVQPLQGLLSSGAGSMGVGPPSALGVRTPQERGLGNAAVSCAATGTS